MISRSGSFLMLSLAIGLSVADASAQARPRPPRETAQTRRGELMLLQNKPDSALIAVQPALTGADSANALVHAIAGEAHASVGDIEAAQASFATALRLYPDYAEAIEGRRTTAWARLYNQGATTYATGDVDATIEAWEKANAIAPGYRVEGYMNVAILYLGKRDYDKAITNYRAGLEVLDQPAPATLTPEELQERTETRDGMVTTLGEIYIFTENWAEAERLFASELAKNPGSVALQSKVAAAIAKQPGREAEATVIYDRLLSLPDLSVNDYHDIGVALFTAKNFPRATEAFARVTAARPNSREAWYNHANAIYGNATATSSEEQWAALMPIAQKLLTLDPLYEDSWLVLKEAQRNTRQNDAALATLVALDALPIKLADMSGRATADGLTVRATVIGNAAAAGTPLRIRFTAYDAAGNPAATQEAQVSAPAKDATAPLSVELAIPGGADTATGYRYELVQ